MTKFRKLGKRGLALFVALVLLVGMVPFSASALAAIPGFTPTDRFYANGKEVAQLYEGTYPNNPVYAYTNPPTTIVTKVGERGADQRLYTKSATCHCGNVLVEVTPDWIAVDENRKLTSSDTSIANPQNIDWKLEGYSSNDWQDADYLGYPALEIGVTGQTPGYSTLKFQTYQNYYYYYTWQRCNRCNQVYSEISFKRKWIEDTETINVTVNADYKLVYDAKGGSGSMNPTTTTVANTTASLKAAQNAFTAPAGMKFKEWNTEADGTGTSYAPGAPVTLDWEEGKGSTANPVTKTLYAIWEDDGPTKPDAPTREDLFGILRNFVKVKCVSTGDGLPHDEKTYSTWSNSTEAEAEVGTVTKNETTGKWECPVTLNSKVYAKMYALAPAFGVGETHELAQGQAETETITLTWDSEASKWKGAESKNTILATICVTCKPDPIPTTYTVVHEYYTNDTRDGSFTESFNGTVGDTVTAGGITKVTDYQGETYGYTSATPEEITLNTGDNTITLRYDRDTTPPVEPDPAEITVKWLNGYDESPVQTADTDASKVLTDGEFNIDEETGYLTGTDMDDAAIEYPADPTRDGYRFTGWGAPMWEEGSENTVITITAQWENNDPDPTDPGPGPEEPTTPIKPPVVIVTPEPVATPTPSAEPTAGPTDDPGVDIPDPTQPPLGPGPSDDPGTDIPDEEPPMGDNPVLNLVDHYHYLVGYPDGSIRPGANITRAEVAEVFYRLMTADARVANWATGNSYSDVIDTAWYTDAINVMSKAGIVNGYEDGTARPNRAITRAEFAMIASQFLADYVEDPGTTTFTDIQGHWAESAIRKVQSIGWVNGDAGTTNFRPNDKITRAEAAVIFNNMLERTPDAEHLDGAMKVWPDNDPGAWYYAAMQEATNSHYYTGNEGTANEEWAEVFEHDWVALKAYWKANAGQSPEE